MVATGARLFVIVILAIVSSIIGYRKTGSMTLGTDGCSASYKYLLFEGGGVKGIAYGGSVHALEDAHMMSKVEGFGGTSAGSQVAALLAAGYTGLELSKALMNFDFKSLMDTGKWGLAEQVATFKRSFGFFIGDRLEETIDGFITAKTGLKSTTFEQLFKHPVGKGRKLVVPAFCVNTGRLVYFDAQRTPDVPISKAVRASSSIPVFYQPTNITVDGKPCLFVDGGILRNLPHDAFDIGPSARALGLSLRDNGLSGIKMKEDFEGVTDFMTQLLEGMSFGPDSANSLEVSTDKEIDILHIDSGAIGTTDFESSSSEKATLVAKGYDGVRMLLANCSIILPEMPRWLESLQLTAKLDEFNQMATTGKVFTKWWSSQGKTMLANQIVFNGVGAKAALKNPTDIKVHDLSLLRIRNQTLLVSRKVGTDMVGSLFPAYAWRLLGPAIQLRQTYKHFQCVSTRFVRITQPNAYDPFLKKAKTSLLKRTTLFEENSNSSDMNLGLCGTEEFTTALCNHVGCLPKVTD